MYSSWGGELTKAFEQRNKETLAFEQLGLADLGNQRVIIQMVN